MTTRICGRYRASRAPHPATWVFAAVGALVVFAVLALAGTAAFADTYNYARWPKGTVCIVDKTSGNARTAVYNTVQRTHQYKDYTGLAFTRRPGSNPTCSGYKNRIIIKQAWSSSSNRSLVQWNGFTWSSTYDAWMIKSPVTIVVNSRYRSSVRTLEWIVSHELGHTAGLDHVGTCSSVMRSGWSKYTASCPAPRFWTYTDRKRIRGWYQ